MSIRARLSESFPGHAGRPGQVGGSAKAGTSVERKGLAKSVRSYRTLAKEFLAGTADGLRAVRSAGAHYQAIKLGYKKLGKTLPRQLGYTDAKKVRPSEPRSGRWRGTTSMRLNVK